MYLKAVPSNGCKEQQRQQTPRLSSRLCAGISPMQEGRAEPPATIQAPSPTFPVHPSHGTRQQTELQAADPRLALTTDPKAFACCVAKLRKAPAKEGKPALGLCLLQPKPQPPSASRRALRQLSGNQELTESTALVYALNIEGENTGGDAHSEAHRRTHPGMIHARIGPLGAKPRCRAAPAAGSLQQPPVLG